MRNWRDRCGLCQRLERVEKLTRVEWTDDVEHWPLVAPVCGDCWINLPPVVDFWTPTGVRKRLTIVARAY